MVDGGGGVGGWWFVVIVVVVVAVLGNGYCTQYLTEKCFMMVFRYTC